MLVWTLFSALVNCEALLCENGFFLGMVLRVSQLLFPAAEGGAPLHDSVHDASLEDLVCCLAGLGPAGSNAYQGGGVALFLSCWLVPVKPKLLNPIY